GSGGRHVVDQQDRFTFKPTAVPRKRAEHVLEPTLTVVTHLRRRGARTDEYSGRHADDQAAAQLPCEELGLVEAALPLTHRVQGDRHDPWRGDALDRQPLGDERGQGPGETPPAFVLEAVHRRLDRSLIRNRRAQSRERLEPDAAGAILSRREELHPTSPA